MLELHPTLTQRTPQRWINQLVAKGQLISMGEGRARPILGIYELTRIELLRDLFIWAYERSTQEYIAIKQSVTEPDSLRLRYREIIKQIIHDVDINPEDDPLLIIQDQINKHVEMVVRENMQSLINDELRRLHEGTLARYHLRLSEFVQWREKQKNWG